MKLEQLKKDYKNGNISKQDYIDKMHELHKMLFEYASFIRKTDIGRIEIADASVIMTSRNSGIKMICDKTDKRIIPIEILNFDFYEKEDFAMILSLIKDDMTVYDIGANIGWYSLNVSKAKKNINLLAFEPIPQTFQYLKQNLLLNNINNVQAFNFGFSNEDRELYFYYTPEGSGNTSLVDLSGLPSVEKIASSVRKLDNFAVEHKAQVDFIKCDVEGAELFVFQGGRETIERCKPIVFTEMLRKWSAKFNYHPNEIIALFTQHGYQCFVIEGDHLAEFHTMDDKTEETNYLFLHSIKHEHVISEYLKP